MKTLVVVAGIIIRGNKVLIAQRKEGKAAAGFWEFPGGKIEEQEPPDSALVRELWEELHIRVRIQEFFAESTHHDINVSIRLLSYIVETDDTIRSSTDHERLEWIKPSQYESYPLLPADIPIMQLLIQKLF